MSISRRIQLTGRSTYTISLPREWIDRLNVQQGDELSILEQSDGTLLISKGTLAGAREKEVIIDIDKIEDINLLEKLIISKYLAGFTKVIISSKKEIPLKIRKAVTITVENLIGSEIISEGFNEIEIRDLAVHGEFPIDKAIRRAHLIARGMQTMALEAFANGDIESAKDISGRESSVDRLYFLIRREIISALENPNFLKELDIKPQDVLYIYPVAKSLEKIADHCESIASSCIELDGKKIDEDIARFLISYSDEAMEIHTQAIQSFLSKKMDLAFKAIKIFQELQEKLKSKKLSRKRSTDFDMEIHIQLVERNLDRICGYGLDIAEMAIDRIH
ncbi:MAG: AbrB/MazE/SpoVT family DNA-binding domain-containing protein [Candidatus Heimdallarchaeota archaeon]|nr:AbrB/MazE/SpoVT family DNA-binding domain-containing protein [Candidatus Heimdallarchaeota archaeon]